MRTKVRFSTFSVLFIAILFLSIFMESCQSPASQWEINRETMANLGQKHKQEFSDGAKTFEAEFLKDSSNLEAALATAEMNILLYIFGYTSREETIPLAKKYFQKAQELDSSNAKVIAMSGMLNFLDYNWLEAKADLEKAIELDPHNGSTRHWYSLYLSTMGKFDEAMAQNDSIMKFDTNGDFLIGRGSLLYFARRNEEMRVLMQEVVDSEPNVPWGYDWLGMAHVELKDYKNSIDTYFTAFELSDGTVEVGAGLGHALGLGGEYDLAKEMADYYEEAAKDKYLPPVQRAFVHIGIGEHEKALDLLEQAYQENSWFLAFMQVEPWLDPLRDEERFKNIMKRMNFPE